MNAYQNKQKCVHERGLEKNNNFFGRNANKLN